MPTATVNGIEIHYREAGEGFPVVLVHGFRELPKLGADGAGPTRALPDGIRGSARACTVCQADQRSGLHADLMSSAVRAHEQFNEILTGFLTRVHEAAGVA